jgi:hypothetical protein
VCLLALAVSVSVAYCLRAVFAAKCLEATFACCDIVFRFAGLEKMTGRWRRKPRQIFASRSL